MEEKNLNVEKLAGESNWDLWKFQMKLVLQERELLEVVIPEVDDQESDSSKPEPKNNKARIKKDLTAQRIIGTSVTREASIHILACTSAEEMWTKLVDTYEMRNEMSMLSLNEKFITSKKLKSETMITYISRMEEMSRKLANMSSPIADGTFMSNLLRGLPKEYRHFTTCWESAPRSERTMQNLKTRLRVEEDRQGIEKSSSNDPGEALAVKKFGGKFNKPQNKGKTNDSGNQFTCHVCHEPGHFRRNCPTRRKDVPRGALLCGNGDDNGGWIGDSGASDHMCNNSAVFNNITACKLPIKVANGAFVEAIGKGSVEVECYNGREWILREMKDVLYVPALEYNLFSLSKVLDRGYRLEATANEWKALDGQEVMVMGVRKTNHIYMQVRYASGYALAAKLEKVAIGEWHDRLAHQNAQHIRQVLKRNGIEFKDEQFQCEACIKGKMHRLSFPTSESKSSACGELIHADVCGPMPVTSLGGARYFLLMKDDYSHFRVVYFLKAKSDVAKMIKDFIVLCLNRYDHSIKVLRTDNGLEFINSQMKEITAANGIVHQTTVAYTPEQNGSAEREMRTLVEAARSLLLAKELNENLWAEAINTSTFVLNRTGTSSVKDKSPIELWTGEIQDFQVFKVFGAHVYCHIPGQQRKKFDAKAEQCTFVGYADNQKGFRVLNARRNRVEVARDVVFRKPNITLINTSDDEVVKEAITQEESVECEADKDERKEELIDSVGDDDDSIKESITEPGLDESLCGVTAGNIMPTRLRGRIALATMVAGITEPTSFKEAERSDQCEQWRAAMKEEMDSLQVNGTWELVAWNGQPLVDNRWTFKAKLDSNGKVDRFKARLVARGFTQQHGVDYWDTYSPVMRMESARIIFAIAAARNMHMEQFDVKTAFLNGELEEEIYMKQPVGFTDGTDRVCLLRKSLYGLKQAARCWNVKFVKVLLSLGLRQCVSDPCVFTGGADNSVMVGIYVDDGIIVAQNKTDIKVIMQKLSSEFDMTVCKFGLFLGMDIKRDESGLSLGQCLYAERVLQKFGMDSSHPVSTPVNSISPNSVLYPKRSEFPYREAVGSLLYLAVMTRPDLSFAVGVASRHLESPTSEDVLHVKRILRYLRGTVNVRLRFGFGADLTLSGFSDSDYAGDVETRRSTSGYVFFVGAACISWRSERQEVVATSTTEAEYIAAAAAVKELKWLKEFIFEIVGINTKPILYLDNQGTMKLIESHTLHRRSKHIDVRYHYIREKYNEGIFKIEYVTSQDQKADILTKGLGKILHEKNVVGLGLE